MILSLAMVFLVGMVFAAICSMVRLPRIIGMIFTGILLGPCVLNLLDPSILSISAELRSLALIIILIKAGLTLDLADLKKVGRPAMLMSFLPAVFEILAFILLAPAVLGVNRIEAALMGSVLAAVSPAVVVPRMVDMIERGYGTKKGIPQMILAGASLDDVFVIVLFSVIVGMAQGETANVASLTQIPVSIVLGLLGGALVGYIFAFLMEALHTHKHTVRNSIKIIVMLGLACFLYATEKLLKGSIPFSGLLAVMSMACIYKMRAVPAVSRRLADKFGKLWLAAEIVLFVLVGAAVDIRYTLQAGAGAIVMIAAALVFRSIGVVLCVLGTQLNRGEKLYCVLSYLPKATVQAAIGTVPLSLGLACGNIVLSVAVLSILITAPIGAFAMDLSYRKLLTHDK